MKQKRVQRETNKTKLPSECQQETNEKKENKKQPSFKERTKQIL